MLCNDRIHSLNMPPVRFVNTESSFVYRCLKISHFIYDPIVHDYNNIDNYNKYMTSRYTRLNHFSICHGSSHASIITEICEELYAF